MGGILMITIDVVVTATLRPKILDTTLHSFRKRLLNDENYRYNLIINIDPAGNKRISSDDVLAMASKHFDNIIHNVPQRASFPMAVMWVWSNTKSDYVFHLEDDWVLQKDISISDMINIIDKYDKICCVRLSKGPIGAGGKMIKPYPCEYADLKDRVKFQLFPRISLNPTLFRGEFVRKAVEVMTPNINPESQLVKKWAVKNRNFKSDRIDKFLEGWDYSVYTACGEKPVIKDTGRMWRDMMKIKRDYDFVNWG